MKIDLRWSAVAAAAKAAALAWRYARSEMRGFEEFMVAHEDVGNLCEGFDENGHPTPAGIAAAERFIARAKNWTPAAWFVYHAWADAQAAARAATCEVTGHRWVDESYGGPDSGCAAARCARCGWSFHKWLY